MTGILPDALLLSGKDKKMKQLMIAAIAFALSSLSPAFAGEVTSVEVNTIVVSDIMGNMMEGSPELAPFMVPGDKIKGETICYPGDMDSEVFQLQCWLKGSSATLEMRGTVKFVVSAEAFEQVEARPCQDLDVMLYETRTLVWRAKCGIQGKKVSVVGVFNPK